MEASRISYRQAIAAHGEKFQFIFKPMVVQYPEKWFPHGEVSIYSYASQLEAERILMQLRARESEAYSLVQEVYNSKPGLARNKPLRSLTRFWKQIEQQAGVKE